MSQLAFFVNSDACSGCKTCQVACKDRHDLPAGVHWRRVYEVAAGAWQRSGDAWAHTVSAYHLSVACHHCADPVCGKQCSVEAIWKRPDGIVLIDQARCVKCNKCRADCPYDAIRYEGSTNAVSKCDFCVDDLEAGRPPACVAACPNRALDWGELNDLRRRFGPVDRIYPLEDPSASRPAVVFKPHRHAAVAAGLAPEVANWEEV
jgi:anaerobic dimethyl sulfoxide reductase subunit B (iron-sulfur subunit)